MSITEKWPGLFYDKGGAVFNVMHPDFGAIGDGVTDDTLAIQAALDAASANSAFISQCFLPAGNYLISDTLFITEGVTFFGVGATEAAGQKVTRITLKTGTEKDMIRLSGHNTAGNWWWFGHIHSMALFGDTSGTVGNGISFRDAADNLLIAQDQTTLHDLIIRGCSENALHFPKGSTPGTVRDCKLIFNGGYGIRYTSITTILSKFVMLMHISDVSCDGNISGGMLFEELDDWSSIVITNIRGEKRTNSDRGSVTGQEDLLIFDNCARTAVSVHGLNFISSVKDLGAGSGFEAPGAAIKIQGIGAPSLRWAGSSIRIRDGDSGRTNTVLLNDTISSRILNANTPQGSYNTLTIVRDEEDVLNLATRTGTSSTQATALIKGLPNFVFGDPILTSLGVDLQGISIGQGYIQADKNVFTRLENFTSGSIDLANAPFNSVIVPNSMFKAQAAVAWDPAGTIDGALVSVTVAVPSVLGDLIIFSHGANLKGMLGTSYISAADTATVQLQNETGTSQNVDSSTLTVYVFKEDSFLFVNSVTFNPASLADQVGETTTVSVPGARLGDFVVASFSVDLQNIIMSPYVSVADTVSIRFHNETGGI